jgi:putative ABC transport system permease protein
LPTAEALKIRDSNIKYAATTDWGGDHLLSFGETRFNKRGFYVSDDFLRMFKFALIKGQPEHALSDPYSILISQSTAEALFGSEDPLNRVIRIDDTHDVKITGVLKDIPDNSSFQFDYLLPFTLYEKTEWVKDNKDNWGNYSWPAYIELHPHASRASVEENIRDLLTLNGQTDIKREFFIHPMSRWRLFSNFENGKESGGLIDYVNMFSLIGIFILVIACINFMNLATARSERRAREVGIRKSVGSKRKEIVFQFLGESIMISIIAFAIALILTEISLPAYNTLLEKKLSIDYTSLQFWGFAIAIILITGILSGSYPAFYLSSFNVTRVLKGKVQVGKGAVTPRKVLVVMQFVFAISLVVISIVIQRQIDHVRSRQLGYDQENLITVNYTAEIGRNYRSIKQELLNLGVVESVTKSNSPITGIYSNNFLDWPGKPSDLKVIFSTIATEYDYTKTMGIKMVAGRDFSEDFPSDTSAIVINKAALDVMGLDDPIGETVELWGTKRQIIGVTENVLMGSLFHEVAPLMMVKIPEWISAVTIRLRKTNDLPMSLKQLEDVFRKYNPAYPFEYTFVDQEFAKKFATINQISRFSFIFTILAICITGLGLFGLAAFTAEQRTKEVGIRKVLGASVSNLILLMSREFAFLVVFGFILATPLAWWGANEVLGKYQYRIEFPVWVLPSAGLIALVFTLAIVGTQAFKAASANPVNSLRSE